MRIILLTLSVIHLWNYSGFSQGNPQNAQPNSAKQDTRSQALARLKPGSLVRVHVLNLGSLQGRFLRSTGDTLFLHNGREERSVPAIAIDALHVRGRATKAGAITGSILGGLGGLGFGIFYNLLCASYEGGDDPCPEYIPLFTAGGVVAGGLLGTAFGAAIPRWHRRYGSSNVRHTISVSDAPATVIKPEDKSGIGGAWLFWGFAKNREPGASGGSLGGRVNLFAKIFPNLTLGPEVGYYKLGQGPHSVIYDGDNVISYRPSRKALHAGLALRLSVRGKIYPFAISSLGYYRRHGESDYFGPSFGGGLNLQLASSRHFIGAEARWHRKPGSLAGFFTILVGISNNW